MQTNATCTSSSNNSNGSDPDAFGIGMNMGQHHQAAGVMMMMNDWPHLCPYCSKSFETSQALGGHQNAHRRERDADRREYLANKRAAANNRITRLASVHHSRSAPVLSMHMLPHSSPVFGSGLGYGPTQVGFQPAGAAAAAGFAYEDMQSSVYGVQIPPAATYCRYCYRWYRDQQAAAGGPVVEYKFLPPREANLLGGRDDSEAALAVSSSPDHDDELMMNMVVNIGDDDVEHEVVVNSKRRLDLTLRL